MHDEDHSSGCPKLVFPSSLIIAAGRGRTERGKEFLPYRIKRKVDGRSKVASGH